jgi:hypothetical protein
MFCLLSQRIHKIIMMIAPLLLSSLIAASIALPLLPLLLDPLPPRQDVRQTFLFDSSGPFTLYFQDTFCPGLATLIWDNDVFLGTTPSRQNYCGVSASGFTSAIVSPQFTSGSYDRPGGFHNLTVVVYASPTPNGKATVSINLFPLPGTKIVFKSMQREWVEAGVLPRPGGKGELEWREGGVQVLPAGSVQII